jgi:hypothetical protein
MHDVPLVVAGPALLDPYGDYAARVLDRTDDVVDACEEVAVGFRRSPRRSGRAIR